MKEFRNPAPLPDADGHGTQPEGSNFGIHEVIGRLHRLSPDTVYKKKGIFPIATPTMGRADLAIHSKVVGDRHETVVEGLYTRNGEEVTLTARGERLTMTVGDNRVRGAEVDAILDTIAGGLAVEGHRIGTSHTPPDAPSAQADRLHALSVLLPYGNEFAETTWTTENGVRHSVISSLYIDGLAAEQASYMKRTPQMRPVPGVSERPILVDTVEEVLYFPFLSDWWYAIREEIPDEIMAALPGYQQEAAQRYNREQYQSTKDKADSEDKRAKNAAARQAITDQADLLERIVSGRDEIGDGDTVFTGTSDPAAGGYVIPERGDDARDTPRRDHNSLDGFDDI